MTNEEAARILDPATSAEALRPFALDCVMRLVVIEKACRVGAEALRRRVPESPYPDGDACVLACPSCGSGEYLHNEDGSRCRFCGQCGQAIDWDGDAGEEAE